MELASGVYLDGTLYRRGASPKSRSKPIWAVWECMHLLCLRLGCRVLLLGFNKV